MFNSAASKKEHIMDQTSKLKEQKDHGTSVFPCGLYEIFDDAPWNGVKHHWHDGKLYDIKIVSYSLLY